MEVALRRRLEGVAGVSISQRQQTAEVTFGAGDHRFSPQAFREAINEAGVKVLSVQIEACGVIQEDANGRRLVSGRNTFVLVDAATTAAGQAVCVTGTLDDTSDPPRLEVKGATPAS